MRFPIAVIFMGAAAILTNSISALSLPGFGAGRSQVVERFSKPEVNQILRPGDFGGLNSLQLFGKLMSTQVASQQLQQLTHYKDLVSGMGNDIASRAELQLSADSFAGQINQIFAEIDQIKSMWALVAQGANNQISLQLMGTRQRNAPISQIIGLITPIIQGALEKTAEIEDRIGQFQLQINAAYQQAASQKNVTSSKSFSVSR